jgi:phage shock protein PspC (stress-responsive transcriptional regulator)
MKHVLFIVIAVVGGYGVTLLCYIAGLVQPSLFLARLVAEDRGGDTLIVHFLVINTVLSAVGIYLILWFVTRKRRPRAV